MRQTPDGLWQCRTYTNYSIVLQAARQTLPDLPPLHEFVAAYGFEAIDRLRLAMRKPPSQARGTDGKYRYARVLRYNSLDELLARREAVALTSSEVDEPR